MNKYYALIKGNNNTYIYPIIATSVVAAKKETTEELRLNGGKLLEIREFNCYEL